MIRRLLVLTLAVGSLAIPAQASTSDTVLTRTAAPAVWTPERIAEVIRTAKPMPTPVRVPRKSAVGPTGPARDVSQPTPPATRIAVSNAVGRLYIVNPDGSTTGWCSAEVINSPRRDLIGTAAHCVHSGGSGGQWYFNTNAFFVPAKNGPGEPLGVYWVRQVSVWGGWVNDQDFDKDYAFINMNPKDGVRIVDAVGGNGLRVNASYQQTAVITGYPADPPYPGDVPYTCDRVRTYKDWFQNDIKADCGILGPGSSGGPWLLDYDYGNGLGYLNGVTSRINSERTTIRASYFNDNVKNLFTQVG